MLVVPILGTHLSEVMIHYMKKTIHDAAYDTLLEWLKEVRAQRKKKFGKAYSMRALVPCVMKTLGRPQMKFSWIAKVEQKERRMDILEYVAYCMALGVDPHEGLQKIIDHLKKHKTLSQYTDVKELVWGKVAEQEELP